MGTVIGDTEKLIIAKIKALPAYKTFTSKDGLAKYQANSDKDNNSTDNSAQTEQPSLSPVFSGQNHRKLFLLVYLPCPGFTALKIYDPSLVLGCDSWASLVTQFSTRPYIINSPHIQSVVFGSLATKFQIVVQQHIVQHVLNHIQQSELNSKIISVSSQEIYLSTTEEAIREDYRKLVSLLSTAEFGENFQIQAFRLLHLSKNRPYFVKEIFESCQDLTQFRSEFTNIVPNFYAMAFKFYYHLPLHENDRKFLFEGALATYDNSIFSETNSEVTNKN